MQKEIWKDVLGYENYYQVSNLGNVKGLDRIIGNHAGTISNKKGKKLSLKKHYKGYLYVSLNMKSCRKEYKVHRLVLSAFTKVSLDYKMQVNHIDSNRSNNKVENLEWVTASQNQYHSYNSNNRMGAKCKLVLDNETGIFYDSIKLASIAKCINYNTLNGKLNNRINNNTSLKKI